MAETSGLPERFHEGLVEVYELVRQARQRAAGLRGEAEIEGVELKPLADTLGRKAAALGHVMEDLAAVPSKVAEHQDELKRRREERGAKA